jgi:hypothetical protein
MKRRYSLPFKTAVGQEVTLEPWHYRINDGDWLLAESNIPGWDYLAPLHFRRDVAIDASALRRACSLNADARIQLVVTVHSPVARFRRVLARDNIPSSGSSRTALSFAVPSTEIATSLRLETEIVLTTSAVQPERFAARFAGSRLYEESVTVNIEGAASRMPIEEASFSRDLPWLNAPRAPWHVDCGSRDLHSAVMHDLRVFLNSDVPAFIGALGAAEPHVHGLLRADIAKRILEMAFEEESFLAGQTDFSEGSMGQVALRLLRLCFGSLPARDASELLHRQPGKFDALIRSCFSPEEP